MPIQIHSLFKTQISFKALHFRGAIFFASKYIFYKHRKWPGHVASVHAFGLLLGAKIGVVIKGILAGVAGGWIIFRFGNNGNVLLGKTYIPPPVVNTRRYFGTIPNIFVLKALFNLPITIPRCGRRHSFDQPLL